MLDKSVLDFQLTEVFGQYGLEAREFDLLCQLFSTGKSSVPSGQFPGLLVKGMLVVLSFPGVVIAFYSKDEEVQKVSSRLGEVGVDSLGVIGEATPIKDIQRTFARALNGQLSLLFIHSSLSVDNTVVAGYESLSGGDGISACFLSPDMFHRVEVKEWAQVYSALSNSFPVHCRVPIMELGGLEATEGAAGSFDLSEAEKQAIFSPLDGDDEDEEEFMRTVIRTSPFHNNPSGLPVDLEPVQMPTGDGRVQNDKQETAEEHFNAFPQSQDTLTGFQSMNSILGRAVEGSEKESEDFLKARSQVSVRPPSNSGEELEGASTSRLDNLFNTWAGEIHTVESASGDQDIVESLSSGISDDDYDDDEDEDELEVMLVEGDDESELEDLISILDMEDSDLLDEAESRDTLAKSVTETFPTFGEYVAPVQVVEESAAGSVTSVMLPSEVPQNSLDQRTGAVTSIILPGDIELEDDEEFIEDDLADLLGADMEDELLSTSVVSDVVKTPSYEVNEEEDEDDDDDDDDDLLGLLDTIVGGKAPKIPEDWVIDEETATAAESVSEVIDSFQETLPDTHIEYFDDDYDDDDDDPENIEAAMKSLVEDEMNEQSFSSVQASADPETSGLDQIELDMADSLSDDFSPLDDELDDDMVMEAEFLPDTHIEYLDDDDDDDESPADIEAALFALSQEEMGPSNLEPLSADEPQYIDVSDAEDLLLDALSEGIPSSQELDEASAIELEDESFEVSAIEPEDESFEASAIEPEDEPYEVSAIEPEDESDAEALIADLFGDDDMFPDESTSSPLEEISEASPVVDDEFVDEDSIDAMEAALMRMAEEEFSNSAVVAPVEDDFSSSFQATEDFILDDIEDSLKRMAADEQEGNPVFPDQSSDSSSIESQATGADDETDDDFDSPEAIEAALLRLAGQDYHPSVDNRGRDAGDDSPSIDAMMPPSFDEEEIVGGGQALGLHFEPDDELDEDSPELIEAALLRLARDESGEESDIVANETSMDDLDAELNSLMDDLDGSFEEDSPEVALVENLSAELSPPDDDLDPLESIVTMDTVEIPVSSVFEDIPDIVPDEFAEGNSFEAVPEIFGDEFSSEPVPEIFGNEFSAEPVPEIFGNEFSAEPVQEFPGDEFSEGPVSEIFADELASGPLVQPSYDSTSLNLGDLVGPASPAVSFDSGTEEGAVTSIILPEDDDDLGFALDALASESFGENTSSDYENTSSDYESALDNSVLGDLEELDNILLSSDGEAAPMFTDSFDGLTEDFPEQGAIESDVLAEEEALVDDYDPEPFAEPVAQAVKPVVGGLDSLSLDLSSLVGGSSNTSAQPSFDAEEGAVSRIILSGSGSDDALEDALNALTSAEGFDSSVSGNDFDGLSIDEPGSPLEQALDNMSDDALLDDQFNTEPVYEEFSLESPIESAYDVIPESREEFYEDGVLPVTEDSFFADALADAEEVLSQDSQEILQDSFIFSPDGFDVNAPGESQIDAVGTFTQDDRLSVDPLANEAPVFDDYGQDVPFAASGSLDDAFEAASMVFNEAPSTGKFDEPVSHFVFDPEPEPEFVEPFEAPLQGYYADGPPEYLFGGGEAQTSDFVQEVAAPVGPRIMPAGIGLSPEVENIVGPQVDDFSTIFKSVELIVSNGNSAVIEEELSILESTYPDDSKVIFALGALDILRNYHTSGTARLFNAAQRCHFSSDFDNEIYVLERLYSEDNTDTGLTHTLADRLMASDQSFRAAFVLRESADRSLEAGATSDAISLLEKAIVADPEDDSAFALLLQAYRAIGRDSQALEVINSRLASAPDKLELLMEQSISLYRLGRLDMAEEVFEGVMIYSADSIDILLDLEAGYDRDDVTTFREKCRERILMIDSTNEAIIKKIRKEDRLASLELDVPLLEDLLPYDEPDVEQGSSAFVSGFGDEDEVPDTMFTRAISVSPRCSALIEQLESLEGEMKILEDGEQVADRYVAELVRKFLEVGSKISTDDPANAMAFYDRSRSYLNYFDDPAASFLWSEQLERRISSLRELIQTER